MLAFQFLHVTSLPPHLQSSSCEPSSAVTISHTGSLNLNYYPGQCYQVVRVSAKHQRVMGLIPDSGRGVCGR